MLFKKEFDVSTKNGVVMGNGKVSFQSVKLNVHCFVVDGVLIDTGSQSLEKEFKPFFLQQEVDQVMITHYHEDHTDCASYLQYQGKTIYMNELYIDCCQKKADYPLYRRLFWGKRQPFKAEPIGETFTSKSATWDVIPTPGHAEDHLAFLNRQTGQLFTGDLYCQERTKVVLREESIPTLIESLQRVLMYDFDEVYCCHAGYLEKGRRQLERKLHYLLEIQDRILQLHAEGKREEEITHIIFPKKYPITRFSMGEWSSLHIIRSVINESLKRTAT